MNIMEAKYDVHKSWLIEGAALAYRYVLSGNPSFFLICNSLERHWYKSPFEGLENK